jgi:hypothetical protein
MFLKKGYLTFFIFIIVLSSLLIVFFYQKNKKRKIIENLINDNSIIMKKKINLKEKESPNISFNFTTESPNNIDDNNYEIDTITVVNHDSLLDTYGNVYEYNFSTENHSLSLNKEEKNFIEESKKDYQHQTESENSSLLIFSISSFLSGTVLISIVYYIIFIIKNKNYKNKELALFRLMWENSDSAFFYNENHSFFNDELLNILKDEFNYSLERVKELFSELNEFYEAKHPNIVKK